MADLGPCGRQGSEQWLTDRGLISRLEREVTQMRKILHAIERRASDAILRDGSKAEKQAALRDVHRLASEAQDRARVTTR